MSVSVFVCVSVFLFSLHPLRWCAGIDRRMLVCICGFFVFVVASYVRESLAFLDKQTCVAAHRSPAPSQPSPAPKSIDLGPKSTEPAPKSIDPAPKSTDPVPKSIEPEPKSIELGPKSTEPGFKSIEIGLQVNRARPQSQSISDP